MITVNPELLCLIASQMPLCCIQPAHPWYEYMQLAHPTQPRVSACVCVREGGGYRSCYFVHMLRVLCVWVIGACTHTHTHTPRGVSFTQECIEDNILPEEGEATYTASMSPTLAWTSAGVGSIPPNC